jgi:hypothetical protein
MGNGVSLVISGLIFDSKHGALHKTIAYPLIAPELTLLKGVAFGECCILVFFFGAPSILKR